MIALKELVLLGVYVDDAAAVARDYVDRLSMREIASFASSNERGRTTCIVMAGSDKPPWLALFSGSGDSIAKQMRADKPPGLHQLVYLTDTYAGDLAWLRRRWLGYERLIPLDGTRTLRRLSATIAELGVVVELIERPPIELDESEWLPAIVESLTHAIQPGGSTKKPVVSARRGRSFIPTLGPLQLRSGTSLDGWLEQIAAQPWSTSCRSVASGKLTPEMSTLVTAIHERGPRDWASDVRDANRTMSEAGLGSRRGESGGGPYPVTASPLFLSSDEATLLRKGAVQHASALRKLLDDLHANRRTPIPDDLLRTNPFSYVKGEWSPPQPAGLSQYLMDVVRDAGTGRFAVVDEGSDSGRCGLSTLGVLRSATERAHRALLDRIDTSALDEPTAHMRQALLDFAPASAGSTPNIVMAYARNPPPNDLVDWEDALLCRLLGIPLVAEAELMIEGTALYATERDGTRRRVDVLLHRRTDTMYRFTEWNRLVRAGMLAVVDPVSSLLINDRALRSCTHRLLETYAGGAPLLDIPESVYLVDAASRARVLEDIGEWTFKERGGQVGKRLMRGEELSETGRAAMVAAIEDAPERWVAQRRIRPATALFFEPSADGEAIDVWEGRYMLHVYAIVGREIVAPNVFACRVFRPNVIDDATLVSDVVVVGGGSSS